MQVAETCAIEQSGPPVEMVRRPLPVSDDAEFESVRTASGRCDYTRGAAELVISFTSAHARPGFDRQHEWGMMAFADALENLNR